MEFFKRFFGKGHKLQDEKRPDNTRLIFLINNWSEHRSDENYKLVVEELLQGNSFLILPSLNSDDQKVVIGDWQAAEKDTPLKLTSVFNLDGLKVLGAFTDEKSLLFWAKKVTTYTALDSKAALDLCQKINIDRVVINSDSNNMFILQRSGNFKGLTIEKDSTVSIGTPNKP